MGRTLYMECNAGISGDMTVAMLLDLGADKEVLMKALGSIPVAGFQIEIGRVNKSGIDCCDFNVKLPDSHENHDHDMNYLHDLDYQHEHPHEQHHEHNHEHPHEQHHEHPHEHNHEHPHEHNHAHICLSQIKEIITACDITDSAKALAEKIFNIIAAAEAKAHNKGIDEVHFHEVGAVDSIVDIIATAVCFDNLDITNVIVPRLNEGTGTVRCQHGLLPVPVPAVANIIASNNIRLHIMDVAGEFVTPTGAAIVAAVKTTDKLPEEFIIEKTGIGAGKRNYKLPSMLRGMLIKSPDIDKSKKTDTDVIYKLESDIDDCTGENLGYVMEKLFQAGARDVHYHPVYMKKNRPGWQLNVICDKSLIDVMESIIFKETTTIGIRRLEMERSTLPREIVSVDTPYGTARLKVVDIYGKKRAYPEYEDVAAMADKTGFSFGYCSELIKKYYQM